MKKGPGLGPGTFFMNMLGLMNGATAGLFPGVRSPANAMGVLVGRPQTRKSQMTKLSKDIGSVLDKHIRELAVAALHDADEQDHSFGPRLFVVRLPALPSYLITRTPQRVWLRSVQHGFLYSLTPRSFRNTLLHMLDRLSERTHVKTCSGTKSLIRF